MYICAGLVERMDDILFNTAVIFDRNGEYIGKYRKTHLYWPEEIFYGECPGDDYPVFDLDFGTIGIIICYDGWYAETMRLLALKGAELVLYPNAGYEAKYAPARAIDNHVYLAISSWNIESQILDTVGNVRAMTQDGIICSTVDLARRPVPHPNSGGTMNCGSAGRRGVRNAISEKLYEEILQEMKSWENRPEKYTWL
jgi:predicted amidohydrolase